MLLQEHISMLLKSNIPLAWKNESEAAGFVPEAGPDHENSDDVESEKSDEE